MNYDIIEKYFIYNNQILQSESINQIDINNTSIYEVVRVISGIPLFWEEHCERLTASASKLGFSLESINDEINLNIKKLIEINKYPLKNFKLIVFNIHKQTPDYIIFFIKSSYPSITQYENGVSTILYHATRTNPNAKIINTTLREKVDLALQQAEAYEALLVNEYEQITEGSRSNLFFVKENALYTAPSDNVLVGITRKYIFNICSKLNLNIIEKPISISFLNDIDGLFLTGTSPKVLPIDFVDNTLYSSTSNQIIKKISLEYNKIIEEYINNHK